MLNFFQRHGRRSQREAAFPTDWDRLLHYRWRLYRGLPVDLRQQLQHHVLNFLERKKFEGCNGFVVTDEVRLIVAAQACLLLVNRDLDCYPGLYTILVYPDAFVAPVHDIDGLIVTETLQPRSGEASNRGTIVLSWEDILLGLEGRTPYSVVLHEFAHYFDTETGSANGAPFLDDPAAYREWSRVLGEAFRRHRRESHIGIPTLLDPYGATDPAEFFAVATEAFFTASADLLEEYPELYGQLRSYYHQNPIDYYPGGGEEGNEG